MNPTRFESGGKTAFLYASSFPEAPLILLSGLSDDGESLLRALEELGSPPFHLLGISGIDWDHDLSPWDCPPIHAKTAPLTGGADEYLHLILTGILPNALERIGQKPSFIATAGYSLAGLFSLYALYRSSVFSRSASVSGSLWFPGFTDYVLQNPLPKTPDRLYFSLGDKESKTKNPILRPVLACTETIVSHFASLNIPVTLEMNPGNHFTDETLRLAKGIQAILL